jgi:hypothetical protein
VLSLPAVAAVTRRARDVDVPAAVGVTSAARVCLEQVAYINGVEVTRINMTSGSFNGNTPATFKSTEVVSAVPRRLTLPLSSIASGVNVIAVEVHQESVTSPDCVLDARVTLNIAPSATPSPSPTPSVSASSTSASSASATPTQSPSRSLSSTNTGTATGTHTATPLPQGPEAIKWRDQWSFNDSGAPQPSTWMLPGFDDAAWRAGRAIFGESARTCCRHLNCPAAYLHRMLWNV